MTVFLHGGTICLADIVFVLQWLVGLVPFGWGAWYAFRDWRRRIALRRRVRQADRPTE